MSTAKWPRYPAPGVEIDPRVSFGRACITGTGRPTAIIASRFRAGDSIAVIARDCRLKPSQVEAAIRYELIDRKQRAKHRKGVDAAVKAAWSGFSWNAKRATK